MISTEILIIIVVMLAIGLFLDFQHLRNDNKSTFFGNFDQKPQILKHFRIVETAHNHRHVSFECIFKDGRYTRAVFYRSRHGEFMLSTDIVTTDTEQHHLISDVIRFTQIPLIHKTNGYIIDGMDNHETTQLRRQDRDEMINYINTVANNVELDKCFKNVYYPDDDLPEQTIERTLQDHHERNYPNN